MGIIGVSFTKHEGIPKPQGGVSKSKKIVPAVGAAYWEIIKVEVW